MLIIGREQRFCYQFFHKNNFIEMIQLHVNKKNRTQSKSSYPYFIR